ncbi:MAG TPA: acyl-CoA dehydrogenase family protein [Candidatus Limnocylindrales bacterium]|nr:acyl-CoA dehydrogenase family protein [Candidatus Limnocylindrales bacterium]
MYFDLTREQRALRDELRGYFAELMTPELTAEVARSEGGGPLFRQAMRKMGRDKWLGIGWPTEYGGRGMGPIEQFLFADESQRAFFPFPFLTISTVGPTIQQYGTEEQRKTYLPRILAGEALFCIGYSEADAGTDLASLKTRATRDGDDWVIQGQKLWTSLADFADFVWLAARTNPDAPKHAGISMFIVDAKSPGFSHTPIGTIGSIRTNATYYDNVRVPASSLVGGEGNGWSLIVNQLNYERVSLMSAGIVGRLFEETAAWARDKHLADGSRVIDIPWVQLNLARVEAKLEVLRLINWRQAWNMEHGTFHFAEASAVKVFGSEFYIEAYGLLLEVLGAAGMIRRDSPEALIGGRIERMYRSMLILTFGGGTNEIQRDIIAMAGLEMPRSLR